MNLFSTFQNDPFFSGVDLPQRSALDYHSRHNRHDRQITPHRQSPDVFGNPFTFMETMMNNMGQMMAQMETKMNSNDFTGQQGPGVAFSSSTVMSMDSRNGGQPRIVQATSEKLRGPEGFERTRKAVRDTGRNLEKMEVSHRLGERGHRITKERDPTTGQLLENREFDHIEDEHGFEREWFNRAEQFGLKTSTRNHFDSQTNNLLMSPESSLRRLRSQSHEPRHLAIDHERRKN